jgi:hypothetical protein
MYRIVPAIILFFLLAILLGVPAFSGVKDIPSVAAAQKTKNPEIVWTKERLSVRAKEVPLKSLLAAIGKKTGVPISVSKGLEDKPVTVTVEAVEIERGLKAVLNVAGVVNQALVWRPMKGKGKKIQWAIEQVFLAEEGTTRAVISETALEFVDPQGRIKKSYDFEYDDRNARASQNGAFISYNYSTTDGSCDDQGECTVPDDICDEQGECKFGEVTVDGWSIVLDNQGNELWKARHPWGDAYPSPNGKYIVTMPGGLMCSPCPVSIFTEKGLVREIKNESLSSATAFSPDGTFFAVAVESQIEGNGVFGSGVLNVLDQEGHELWRKDGLHLSLNSETQLNISASGIITLGGVENIYQFDQQGNPMPEQKEGNDPK